MRSTTSYTSVLLALAGASVLVVGCSGDSSTGTSRFSGDPAAIAFSYEADSVIGTNAIFVMAPDRSALKKIVDDSSTNIFPDWSPDGRTLLITRGSRTSPQTLWVVQPDGTGLRLVSSGPGQGLYGRWSPDGQSIVFVTGGKLGIERADGSDWHTVASALVTDVNGPPSWSVDGRIAFKRTSDASPGIWTIRADGTGLAQLTTNAGDADPRWSPDGKRLAFDYRNLEVLDNESSVLVVNADGTGRRAITNGAFDARPTWSPDGLWILFDRSVPYGNSNACPLYIVSSAGGDATALLPERTRPSCVGSAWRVAPAS